MKDSKNFTLQGMLHVIQWLLKHSDKLLITFCYPFISFSSPWQKIMFPPKGKEVLSLNVGKIVLLFIPKISVGLCLFIFWLWYCGQIGENGTDLTLLLFIFYRSISRNSQEHFLHALVHFNYFSLSKFLSLKFIHKYH